MQTRSNVGYYMLPGTPTFDRLPACGPRVGSPIMPGGYTSHGIHTCAGMIDVPSDIHNSSYMDPNNRTAL